MAYQLPNVSVAPEVPAGTVYFVRHGLVHNPQRIMYGWLPRVRLAEEGRRQAEAAAGYLVDKGIKLILTSPLLRARQTTRIISALLPGVSVRASRYLIEGGLARYWQGNYWDTLPTERAEEWQQWQRSAGSIEFGESMAAMANRMQAAMAQALRLSHGGPAVCISHRDPILALRLQIEGRSFDELHQSTCNTASVTAVASNGGHLTIVDYAEPYCPAPSA